MPGSISFRHSPCDDTTARLTCMALKFSCDTSRTSCHKSNSRPRICIE